MRTGIPHPANSRPGEKNLRAFVFFLGRALLVNGPQADVVGLFVRYRAGEDEGGGREHAQASDADGAGPARIGEDCQTGASEETREGKRPEAPRAIRSGGARRLDDGSA